MRLSTDNIKRTDNACKTVLSADVESINRQITAIESFCNEDKLEGESYSALKRYYTDTIINKVLNDRKNLSTMITNTIIGGSGSSVTQFWNQFMASDPSTSEIDTSQIDSIQAQISALSNRINEYNNMSFGERMARGLSYSKYNSWCDEKNILMKILTKMYNFIDKDASYNLSELLNKVNSYYQTVSSLNDAMTTLDTHDDYIM